MEVPIGFEPMITELQSIALPLGYGTIKKWWGRRDLNPHGINSQRILSPLRLPISPRPQRLEVPTGFEPVITELQSIALPLGYGTNCLNII